jgi:beta-barrel assembly-enhancing protease
MVNNTTILRRGPGEIMKPLVASVLAIGLLVGYCIAPARAGSSADDQTELRIGQQEYQSLQQKGEIVRSSPYYATLNPIAKQIKHVADSQYFHPFEFILVHETQPNAFAVPGGNVYVTDALMRFARNREELAAVLCHETSHTIHHDVLHLYQKQQQAARNYTIGDILINLATGGKAGNVVDTLAGVGFNLQAMTYSRDVESAADAKGARTCAAAGSNPWGMVWLFQAFEKADTGGQMEMLSDHPTNQHRVDDLRRLFETDPAYFGRYSSNIATATPLHAKPRGTTSAATTSTGRRY